MTSSSCFGNDTRACGQTEVNGIESKTKSQLSPKIFNFGPLIARKLLGKKINQSSTLNRLGHGTTA